MSFPEQGQEPPGEQSQMTPQPESERPTTCSRLSGKVAIITGADSGIGRAVAISFAKEGADIAALYLSEHKDAEETKRQVEQEGRRCLLIPGDIGDESFCVSAVRKVAEEFGKIDILINNAAEQHPKDSITEITGEQLEKTFRTNIFSMFLKQGASIINTASVTAYRGSGHLIDYSSTKGAIVSFTRSLAKNLAEKKIRVNAVAPGPIWTPLIPSTLDVKEFGDDVPLGRAGQPEEVSPSYVFLASDDASYVTGQVMHPNGGEVVNG